MKITNLGHSGFLVEATDCALIFDYYTGVIPELPADTKLYIFVSHRHHDHFTYDIFQLIRKYPQATFILSDDLKRRVSNASKNQRRGMDVSMDSHIHYLKPDQSASFGNLDVSTTDSTDLGVSFCVSLHSDKTIFHAGDLNWWTWMGEETAEEFASMTSRFQNEVAKLAGQQIDLAFLPLDPRQGERFYWGFDYYMTHLNIGCAIPMHFWDDAECPDRLMTLDSTKPYSNKIKLLHHSGDHCILPTATSKKAD